MMMICDGGTGLSSGRISDLICLTVERLTSKRKMEISGSHACPKQALWGRSGHIIHTDLRAIYRQH